MVKSQYVNILLVSFCGRCQYLAGRYSTGTDPEPHVGVQHAPPQLARTQELKTPFPLLTPKPPAASSVPAFASATPSLPSPGDSPQFRVAHPPVPAQFASAPAYPNNSVPLPTPDPAPLQTKSQKTAAARDPQAALQLPTREMALRKGLR